MMSREQPRPDTDRRWQEDAACKTRPDLNWFPGRANAAYQRERMQ